MPKRIDPKWAERFAEAFYQSKWSGNQAEFARRIGAKRARINKWLSDHPPKKPDWDVLERACQLLGVTMNFVLYGVRAGVREGQASLASYAYVPVLGRLLPNGQVIDLPEGNGGGLVLAPTTDQDAYSYECKGYAPAIRDGYLVIVEPSHPLVEGETVMLERTDGSRSIRELLWQRDNRVALMTLNEPYERETLDFEEIASLRAAPTIVAPSKREQV